MLADSDDSRNLIATDPSTGAIIVDLMLLGRVFHYDPADTTTAYDGTTCLVSSDGLRYKLALGTDVFAYAVLDNTIATPPVSPTLGDAYLVAAAATGAWSGKSNFIAVKTNRGWEFVNFSIGRFIYVESVDTYYHKNSGGSWVTGFGNQTVIANSVPLSAAINFGKRLIVENQTTTSPPGSPTVGTAYVIGPSATGGWSGLDGKIAICEVAGSFVVYTPTNGWAAYDKALNNEYIFNGSAWKSAAGAIVNAGTVFTAASLSMVSIGTGTTGYSPTSAPVATSFHYIDAASLSYTAKAAGARLRFTYRAEMVQSVSTAQNYVAGIHVDSVSAASDWLELCYATGNATISYPLVFEITASDASSHTYVIYFYQNSSTAAVTSVSRRRFSVEEFAS